MFFDKIRCTKEVIPPFAKDSLLESFEKKLNKLLQRKF